APPVGATHRPWDTAPPARRAQLVARDGCGAPPGSSTAHRSSHAGTPVTGTDGIAAPASPASRPAQAGTPGTGTDGIQSGAVSDPREGVSEAAGSDGAVARRSGRPAVGPVTGPA